MIQSDSFTCRYMFRYIYVYFSSAVSLSFASVNGVSGGLLRHGSWVWEMIFSFFLFISLLFFFISPSSLLPSFSWCEESGEMGEKGWKRLVGIRKEKVWDWTLLYSNACMYVYVVACVCVYECIYV